MKGYPRRDCVNQGFCSHGCTIASQCWEASRHRSSVRIIRDDRAVILPDGTPATQIAWGVLVAGIRHGGRHGEFLDAQLHQARCEAWTPEQLEDWTSRALPPISDIGLTVLAAFRRALS